ncbi:4-hydroxy-2-oxoheptanedioate aldolase [Roseibacterium beibuensis]|uniref:4-hydroxy-2-oxoheptanedioate aldolase n=1 Tax=[Roseibacterium] beibuensis TaxID=1193142 RepID=A0ABP9L9J3_9RHOB|nr:4-hydroxy-2-oxoheptanedioate aldolase [Roseibacterium beibuensis]MCS6623925.1 4-hydroxy-2-oxoheptanedioate aldolase [Roseibacterium beibuensis]
MTAHLNGFKAALSASKLQIGLWLGLTSPVTAEVCATAGYDWLVIDGEHAPNDVPAMLSQLQVLAAYDVHPVVRTVAGETWMIKQALDLGAQTVLVPMVETPEAAAELVRATRYPPMGCRGVGAALARASRYNRIPDYLATANDQVALIVQVESRSALAQVAEIAAVPGVDGVFIGPADLAADMGFLGDPSAPEVRAAVLSAIRAITRVGKPAGLLTSDRSFAMECIAEGAVFVAVGSDVGLLTSSTAALRSGFPKSI